MGGLAGLTAAAYLAEQGVPPLVLEADSRWPGGRLCGGDPDQFELKGKAWLFHPDQGMHALWGGYDNMLRTINRFTDIDLAPSPGEEWINRWGREVRRIEAGNAVRSPWLIASQSAGRLSSRSKVISPSSNRGYQYDSPVR